MRSCNATDGSSGWSPHYVNGFPLQVLGSTPGRYVMADDDQDPAEFSRFAAGHWRGNVGTFHIPSGIAQSLSTGINADAWYAGDSDDVYESSGLRGATLFSVENRLANVGAVASYTSNPFVFTTVVNGFEYDLGTDTR